VGSPVVRRMSTDAAEGSVAGSAASSARSLPPVGGGAGLVTDVVAAVAGDPTPREAAHAVLQLLVERLRMDAGAFLVRRDDGVVELLSAFGRTRRRGYPYPPVDGREGGVAPLLRGVETVEELESAAPLPEGLQAVACPRASQVVLVPAVAGGVAGGLVQLSRRDRAPLDDDARRSLVAAGRVLALTAQNQLLSTASERSATVLESAYAVSRAISRSLDLERTFRVIAVNAARLVRGTRCLLLELDAASGDLVAVASSEDDDRALLGLRLRFDGQSARAGLAGRHLEIAVEDLVWGAGMGPELRDALAMRTALFLPMLAQNELIGSLVLFSPRHAHRFRPEDVALAEEVAEQAAIAIHNARLYRDLAGTQERIEALLERVTRVREHERRSLATIVHDDILQSVVGAVYKLEASVDDLPPGARPQLEEAIAALRSAVEEAREVISDLRPPALEGLGLSAALRAAATRAAGLGPAAVEVELDDGLDVGAGTATALYKIAREALVNAQRHAGAAHVRLRLRVVGGEEARPVSGERGRALLLRVADDGAGFAVGEDTVDRHYGLAMMEEQATFAGGTFRLRSEPGRGTVVEALLPFGETGTAKRGG